jgi:hypothetical protein
MSVGLGTLRTADNKRSRRIEVYADQYDSPELTLEVGSDGVNVEIDLDRKQMQELSIIIDRFMDKDPQQSKPVHGKNRHTGAPCQFHTTGACTCGLYPS